MGHFGDIHDAGGTHDGATKTDTELTNHELWQTAGHGLDDGDDHDDERTDQKAKSSPWPLSVVAQESKLLSIPFQSLKGPMKNEPAIAPIGLRANTIPV